MARILAWLAVVSVVLGGIPLPVDQLVLFELDDAAALAHEVELCVREIREEGDLPDEPALVGGCRPSGTGRISPHAGNHINRLRKRKADKDNAR
jgi:hypothetical protein